MLLQTSPVAAVHLADVKQRAQSLIRGANDLWQAWLDDVGRAREQQPGPL